jgi:hypothetical protein
VSAACASEESDFQPVLKPYQLVGVNFLLLLHRKNIGGGDYVIIFNYDFGYKVSLLKDIELFLIKMVT